MKYVIGTILLAFALSSVDGFWTTCPGVNAPAPSNIISSHCSHATNRCSAVRGEIIYAEAFFTPTRVYNDLRVRAMVFLLGVGVPLPVPPPMDNGCNGLSRNGVQASCPTTPNNEYLISFNTAISAEWPSFSNARTRFELIDGTTTVLCVEVIADVL